MHLKKKIYLFSGLGADERAFMHLDFNGYSAHFMQWLDPVQNEGVGAYAKRMAEQIDGTDPIFVGISFGGIVAIEVAKHLQPQKLIVIASAKTKYEVPFYFRISGMLGLNRLMPERFIVESNAFTNWIFGARTVSGRKILGQILGDTDPKFFKWAVNEIVNWDNKELVPNIYHIHGSSDRLLPICFVNNDITIKHGGHLMTINKSDELNRVLRKLLR